MVFSQVEMNYDMLNYIATQEKSPDKDDREGIKRQFQTYFIKTVFLNNVFKSDQLFYGETDTNYEIINQLMINQFANNLADTNFLDLSLVNLDDR